MAERRSLVEIALMPLVVAMVGIGGTLLITAKQEQNARMLHDAELATAQEMAVADRQIKVLDLFAQRISSKDPNERVLALRLLRAVDGDLAEKLATAVSEGESQGSAVRAVADQVAAEATARGFSFAVVGSFRTYDEAASFAGGLVSQGSTYRPEVYLSDNGVYGVSLGGYLSYRAALTRVAYAKRIGIATDAYVKTSRAWGANLFK
jgi:hypothetical protein